MSEDKKELYKSLVNHPGWELFVEEVKSDQDVIKRRLLGGIQRDIEGINYDNGRWRGFSDALSIVYKTIEES